MDSLLQDVRYAVRTFVGNRSVALVAVLVLALGIGATTAVYSVVEGVLLRPLPYTEPERLVNIGWTWQKYYAPGRNVGATPSLAEIRAWSTASHSFEELEPVIPRDPVLTGLGDAARISAWTVTSHLFPMLGVHPILGRGFTADDDRLGSAPVVVLSNAFWSSRFGRDPQVLGRPVTLDGTVYRIVGVMSPDFHFPVLPAGFRSAGSDLWCSMGSMPNAFRSDGQWGGWAIGRLRPGIMLAQAKVDLDAAYRHLAESNPQFKDRVTVVTRLQDMAVRAVRPALLLALTAVGLVLLIACANVANLLLARAAARQREMAIRVALGASRLRIVRQLLTEAVMLALGGAALGILLAAWGVPLLVALAGREIPRMQEVRIDPHVLAITVCIAVLTGLVFGLVPALQSVRGIRTAALKEGTVGSGTSAGQTRASGAFVIAQVALTLVLLVGAGLLGRSFVKLMTLDPGFDPDHLIVARLRLPTQLSAQRYGTKPERLAFATTITDRMNALPGVTSAAVSTGMPLAVGSFGSIRVDGEPDRPDAPPADFTAVTPEFFRALGIPLRRGELFHGGEGAESDEVIVNEALVDSYLAGQNPIGKRLVLPGRARPSTIIGVVGDTREFSLDQAPPPVVYAPFATAPAPYLAVTVRTAGDPAFLLGPLRSALHELDPNLPIDALATMRDMMSESLATQRFYATLLGVFSTLALLMAAAGLYALVSYAVVRRTRELGVRMALGAEPRHVLRLVVGRGALLALIGIALGTGAAVAATRVLRSFLFEITPTDPVVFVGVAVGLAVVALVASYLPARRAMRIDPVMVLRDE